MMKGFRAAFFDFIADPFYVTESESVRYFSDGLLVIKDGKVEAFGDYEALKDEYLEVPITAYPGMLITPGFIDMHIHFPQIEMIAAYGEQLLEWLNKYTFPTERKYNDKNYAQEMAGFFLDELLKNGTTTAVVLATVFPHSVDAFFEESSKRNLRMIAGKVMMDRHAPDYLKDTAQSSYDDSKELIEKWHNNGRSLYAITPRFSVTSTPEQLQLAGKLVEEYPDVFVHTHLSENRAEVAFVKELFPDNKNYLDTYEQFGLVGERSIFAHCIHLEDQEFERLSETKAIIAFCPTSNLFLGSGLFKIEQAKSSEYPVKVGLGTDVGGGTSLSMLQTMNEAYKIAQLRQQKLSPFQAFFLATLGSAKALCLDDKIGNFDVGKEADFIVLNTRSTPLMALRNPEEVPNTLEELLERLFTLVIMGDDRAIQSTYIMGELAYEKSLIA
ncbi:guanine deaminase [Aphanothece hegewaldii CCALA 016]|uniref:Guanine deaminase n=1 Tax=Aphanothece hegewaldii CCALA 016 TaxID=2107694 RepID=A0A2T1LRP3_9CHRO|nr:guanine deaminase [Aphanothece hegewaldii]PSF31424.1 guanine deaminase [Aphanothece hegewaldii CCALA 016]